MNAVPEPRPKSGHPEPSPVAAGLLAAGEKHPRIRELAERLEAAKPGEPVRLRGVAGSAGALVAALLARHAPTNLPDDEPWATPLAWAERRGPSEMAALLRRHGADR